MTASVVVDFSKEPKFPKKPTGEAPKVELVREQLATYVEGYQLARKTAPARILLQASDFKHCLRRILARMQKPHRDKAKAAWQERRKAGEYVMSDIRGLLGSFPAMPLNAERAPRSILTGWVAGEPLPTGISLGEECKLEDPIAGGAIGRFQHQELRCDEIDKHLDAGKQATQLALILEDSVSFVLGDDMVVRKLRFLDGALDKLDGSDDDGRRAEFDARFALQIGELGRVFDVIADAFHISSAD